MKSQHLSDEAVAAYADGVLGNVARERASRHVDECDECRTAVRVQREAASVLRAAPAPPLPSSLIDRLRSLPLTTPLCEPTKSLPTVIGPDGATMLAAFGQAAAFVPEQKSQRRIKPFVFSAVLVAVAGSLTAGVMAASQPQSDHQPHSGVGHIAPVHHIQSSDSSAYSPQLVGRIQLVRAHQP